MRNPYLLGALLFLILLLTTTACLVSFGLTQAKETVSNTFTTSATPTIIVESFNGRINVQAGPDDQVAVTVVKIGSGSNQTSAEADLKNLEVNMTQEGDAIRITVRRTDRKLANNSGAEVDLTVPVGAMLDLSTSNGRISTTNVRGDLKLSTSNGELTVAGGQGRQDLRTSNGKIQLEAQAAQVDAHTSNGAISFTGSLTDGNHVFETSNGSVEISLPGDSQFAIDARTSNGRISTDFPVTISGSSDDNELIGTVGNNQGVSIRIQSSNGSIKLLKSQ